jgi:hypothetical protein
MISYFYGADDNIKQITDPELWEAVDIPTSAPAKRGTFLVEPRLLSIPSFANVRKLRAEFRVFDT